MALQHTQPPFKTMAVCCATEIGWDDYGQCGNHRTAVFLMPGNHQATNDGVMDFKGLMLSHEFWFDDDDC
jgi:hypothetical protein